MDNEAELKAMLTISAIATLAIETDDLDNKKVMNQDEKKHKRKAITANETALKTEKILNS